MASTADSAQEAQDTISDSQLAMHTLWSGTIPNDTDTKDHVPQQESNTPPTTTSKVNI